MRKSIVVTLATLAVAAPAHADGGEPGEEPKVKEKPRVVRIAGPIVRLTDSSIVVENRVGDATLACLLPEGKARRVAAAFEVGDAVRMHCLRQRGKRAILLAVKPFDARGDEEEKAKEKKETAKEKAGPAPVKSFPTEAAKPAPKPHSDEVRLYGRIAAVSRESVTVRGESESLTCRVPAAYAEKMGRFAIGSAVKLMCRGGEVTYLEPAG
jgi:hypothetical protein